MKKIGIFIASEQKGFFIAVAYQLEKKYSLTVTIFARDRHVVDLAKKILPEDSRVKIINLSILPNRVKSELAVKESNRIENSYDVKLSMLLSSDRALGQGYLSNVQKIPDIKRASWSYERKIISVVEDFIQKEDILKGLDIVLQLYPNKVVTKICNKNNINFFSFTYIKFADRMFWSDDDFLTGSSYIKKLQKNLKSTKDKPIVDYCIDKPGDELNKSAKYSYKLAAKTAFEIILNDSKKLIRGSNNKHSYHYLGWLPSVFRRVSNYNYVKNNSATLNDLRSYKVVFFTLHLEPEVALQSFSPEFSNSMEAIIWISKSLPAGFILVVKEQVASYAVRSRWYYKQLMKIPNVVLSHPDVHSWDWIKSSSIVATITGTVGQEAIHLERPVISFGKHQIINHLPTVYYVSNYMETALAVDAIIGNGITKKLYIKSKSAFSNAQFDSSINIGNFKNTYRSNKFEDTRAIEAIENLIGEYPEIL